MQSDAAASASGSREARRNIGGRGPRDGEREQEKKGARAERRAGKTDHACAGIGIGLLQVMMLRAGREAFMGVRS